jgi:RNA polymerase-binding protein DksA
MDTRMDQTVSYSADDAARHCLQKLRKHVLDAIEADEAELNHGWDAVDAPAEENVREVEYARHGLLTSRLRMIDEALMRIDAGAYGQCAKCGASIGITRLEAEPEAELCIKCQQESEHGVAV